MIYNKNYNNIIKMMIEKKLSIREMAKINVETKKNAPAEDGEMASVMDDDF